MKEKVREAITVSIIIPIRNEEKYIEQCIKAVISQDFPLNEVEIIFIDGCSTDSTKEIVKLYIKDYPNIIKLLENPMKTVPFAMNIGIKNSIGKYIIRLDAHSKYGSDYISRCISTIKEIDADNVGGLAFTEGKGTIGKAFAMILSSKFGVGNSGFRTNAKSGYVDTVPFGAFKRETFKKYGEYDERLSRNQDYELNYRIRKKGGKVYLNSDIKLTYFCRNDINGIVKQSFENGKWNIYTMKLCPSSMGIRHFIPFVFLLSLIVMPILTVISPIIGVFFAVELGLYFIFDLFFSLKQTCNFRLLLLSLMLFPLFHLSYGMGSLVGVIKKPI